MRGQTPYGFDTESIVMDGIKTKKLVENAEMDFAELMYILTSAIALTKNIAGGTLSRRQTFIARTMPSSIPHLITLPVRTGPAAPGPWLRRRSTHPD